MSDRYELILTCPKGLEGLLLEEATALGLEEGREQTSAVRGYGALEVGYRLCLWSRLANRVLLVISRFPTVDAETLYQGVHAVDWAEHLLPSGSLAVEFSGRGSGIDNTHFGALKVKDAIVDRLRRLQSDPEFAGAMGRAARQSALVSFDHQTNARLLLSRIAEAQK